MDLRLAPAARSLLDDRLARYPWWRVPTGPAAPRIRELLRAPVDDVLDFLEQGLRTVADLLGLHTIISRSSWLEIDPALRGQHRVLEIAAARGATTYVNAPGGVTRYDRDVFRQRGIELRFLTPYAGPYRFLLPALMKLDPAVISADVRATSTLISHMPEPGSPVDPMPSPERVPIEAASR